MVHQHIYRKHNSATSQRAAFITLELHLSSLGLCFPLSLVISFATQKQQQQRLLLHSSIMLKGLFSSKNKTFKPLKNHDINTKRAKLSEFAKATLGSGNMRSAVTLPKNEDLNEWLAVNTVDFFNEISLLYGTITEYCTVASCPVMNAGSAFEYLWADKVKVKTPITVSAPEYVDLLMCWVETQLNDEMIFPLQLGTPFPKQFITVVKTIFKRLFRIYAHLYHTHFTKIVALGAEAHLNTCFKHFVYFVYEFKLIESKELMPLKDLIDSMMGKDSSSSSSNSNNNNTNSNSNNNNNNKINNNNINNNSSNNNNNNNNNNSTNNGSNSNNNSGSNSNSNSSRGSSSPTPNLNSNQSNA